MNRSCRRRVVIFAALLGAASLLHSRAAQPFAITSFTRLPNGVPRAQFSTQANTYYILYRGLTLTNVSLPISMTLGTGGTGTLDDSNSPPAFGFYRVREVPSGVALDTDGDGIDDYYELLHPGCLNPFDAGDALADCDHNGQSNLQEYLAAIEPLLASPGLVINEIDYDQPSTDTAEFVEIFNLSARRLALRNVALVFVNGANNTEYLRVNLTGFLDAGAYLVAASTNVVVPASARVIRFAGNTDAIQNGSPDGVCLFHITANALIDALSYEGSITAAIINGAPGTYNLVEGTTSEGLADSGLVAGSLIRWPNGQDTNNASQDWRFTQQPTPGAANVLAP